MPEPGLFQAGKPETGIIHSWFFQNTASKVVNNLDIYAVIISHIPYFVTFSHFDNNIITIFYILNNKRIVVFNNLVS